MPRNRRLLLRLAAVLAMTVVAGPAGGAPGRETKSAWYRAYAEVNLVQRNDYVVSGGQGYKQWSISMSFRSKAAVVVSKVGKQGARTIAALSSEAAKSLAVYETETSYAIGCRDHETLEIVPWTEPVGATLFLRNEGSEHSIMDVSIVRTFGDSNVESTCPAHPQSSHQAAWGGPFDGSSGEVLHRPLPIRGWFGGALAGSYEQKRVNAAGWDETWTVKVALLPCPGTRPCENPPGWRKPFARKPGAAPTKSGKPRHR